MTFDKEILTVAEAAYYLSCSQQKIYELIHSGSIGAYKDECKEGKRGKNWKIYAFSIDYYVRSRLSKHEYPKHRETIE